MRTLALLGNHPDGVALACALAGGGRHAVLCHTGGLPEDARVPLAGARELRDLEEVLADPAVEAVIVAGPPAARPAQLRRALQSERHVLCVHPCADGPELAYEAGMLQQDTGYALFPLLPHAAHPALARLRALFTPPSADETGPQNPLFRLAQLEWGRAPGPLLREAGTAGFRPCLPGWEVLRGLGGEVVEVLGLADAAELTPDLPALVSGWFQAGGVFQSTYLPGRPESVRVRVVGPGGEGGVPGGAELYFPQGLAGPAFLTWGEAEEAWEAWDPWPALVARFEEHVAGPPGEAGDAWTAAVRSLELDENARRAVQKGRAMTLDYQDASEEVGFKGTMTLAGCVLLWVVLLMLVVSVWVPWVGWVILPLLLAFVAFQALRYLIPRDPG